MHHLFLFGSKQGTIQKLILDTFYLLAQGIPSTGDSTPAQVLSTAGAPTAGTSLSGLPNSAPLNMFPQVRHVVACNH